jgi:hypothetical protein
MGKLNWKSQEQIEQEKVDNEKLKPVTTETFEIVEKRTVDLQEMDSFTLSLAMLIEQRSMDLQGMDDFILSTLLSRIEELEARIQKLEGGTSNVSV